MCKFLYNFIVWSNHNSLIKYSTLTDKNSMLNAKESPTKNI